MFLLFFPPDIPNKGFYQNTNKCMLAVLNRGFDGRKERQLCPSRLDKIRRGSKMSAP